MLVQSAKTEPILNNKEGCIFHQTVIESKWNPESSLMLNILLRSGRNITVAISTNILTVSLVNKQTSRTIGFNIGV